MFAGVVDAYAQYFDWVGVLSGLAADPTQA